MLLSRRQLRVQFYYSDLRYAIYSLFMKQNRGSLTVARPVQSRAPSSTKSLDCPQNTLALIWTLFGSSESVFHFEYVPFIISRSSLLALYPPMADHGTAALDSETPKTGKGASAWHCDLSTGSGVNLPAWLVLPDSLMRTFCQSFPSRQFHRWQAEASTSPGNLFVLELPLEIILLVSVLNLHARAEISDNRCQQ